MPDVNKQVELVEVTLDMPSRSSVIASKVGNYLAVGVGVVVLASSAHAETDISTVTAGIIGMATPIGAIGAAKTVPRLAERTWRIINRFI